MDTDDTGHAVPVPSAVRRVVSLVPSLTETVAVSAPGLLVGATDWCTHPADLDDQGVTRVRGTKNPDVGAVVALRPDLVLVNAEENREPDLRALREAGVPVWVTDVRTVDGAFGSLGRMLAACRVPPPGWLTEARAAWAAVEPLSPRRRAAVPIWRRPWMVVGPDTFTADALRRLGVDTVPADPGERYPKVILAELPPHDLVVLPDEPYLFTPDDGPEAFPGVDCALVSGRLLTWYGPSLLDAPAALLDPLQHPLRAGRVR